MTKVKKSSILLTCLLLALLCGLLFYIDGNASKYIIRITRLCAINIVLALSMNLVNGFTGIFSLGHAGFMAIGAYTVAVSYTHLDVYKRQLYEFKNKIFHVHYKDIKLFPEKLHEVGVMAYPLD